MAAPSAQTTRITIKKYFHTLALNGSRSNGNTSDFTEKQPVPLTAQNLNFVKGHLLTLQANVRKIKAFRPTLCRPLLEVLENAIQATIESSETYTNYKEKREEI